MPGRGFLDRLDAPDRDRLEALTTRRSFDRGEAVFLHGDDTGDVYLIAAGQVKLTLGARDGREVLIDIRGPGEIIGEMSLIDFSPRSASGFALVTPTEVMVISVRDFMTLVDNEFAITRLLLDEMVRKVRDATFHQLEYGLDDVAGRISRRLTELSDRFGEPGPDGEIEFRSPLTQQELAEWAGVSRQAVVKEVGNLRDRGWVATKGSHWVIRDPAALRARAAELSGLG